MSALFQSTYRTVAHKTISALFHGRPPPVVIVAGRQRARAAPKPTATQRRTGFSGAAPAASDRVRIAMLYARHDVMHAEAAAVAIDTGPRRPAGYEIDTVTMLTIVDDKERAHPFTGPPYQLKLFRQIETTACRADTAEYAASSVTSLPELAWPASPATIPY